MVGSDLEMSVGAATRQVVDETRPPINQPPILKFFEYKHLPERLQRISSQLHALAHAMNRDLSDGAEKSAGLRKLLEAKDCFVRAELG